VRCPPLPRQGHRQGPLLGRPRRRPVPRGGGPRTARAGGQSPGPEAVRRARAQPSALPADARAVLRPFRRLWPVRSTAAFGIRPNDVDVLPLVPGGRTRGTFGKEDHPAAAPPPTRPVPILTEDQCARR